MFNKTELKKLKKFKNAKKLSTELVKELIEYRDYLRKVSLNSTLNYKLLEEKFKIPVNIKESFKRITVKVISSIWIHNILLIELIIS